MQVGLHPAREACLDRMRIFLMMLRLMHPSSCCLALLTLKSADSLELPPSPAVPVLLAWADTLLTALLQDPVPSRD